MYPEIVVSGQTFEGEKFPSERLDRFVSIGCRFESCSFAGIRTAQARFGEGPIRSEYVSCSFDGARLRMVPGERATFIDCDFTRTHIRDWFAFDVELIDCRFSGMMRRSFFNARPERGTYVNRFKANDFREMALHDVAFRTGIDLSKQLLPNGPEYLYLRDGGSAVDRARARLAVMEEAALKRDLESTLSVLQSEVDDGQLQLFIRPADFGPASAESLRRLLTD